MRPPRQLAAMLRRFNAMLDADRTAKRDRHAAVNTALQRYWLHINRTAGRGEDG
jgi:hypothetical protein